MEGYYSAMRKLNEMREVRKRPIYDRYNELFDLEEYRNMLHGQVEESKRLTISLVDDQVEEVLQLAASVLRHRTKERNRLTTSSLQSQVDASKLLTASLLSELVKSSRQYATSLQHNQVEESPRFTRASLPGLLEASKRETATLLPQLEQENKRLMDSVKSEFVRECASFEKASENSALRERLDDFRNYIGKLLIASERWAEWLPYSRKLLAQLMEVGSLKREAIELAERHSVDIIASVLDPGASYKQQLEAAKDYFGFASFLAALVLQADNSAAFSALKVLMNGRGIIADQERLKRELGGKDSVTAEEVVKAAAMGTIVVINVSFRCDAIIIRADGIRSVSLPMLSEFEIWEHERCFWSPKPDNGRKPGDPINTDMNYPDPHPNMAEGLEWLWTSVAKPILDHLECLPVTDGKWPRVWWIATGMLASFPLHAAGLKAAHKSENPSGDSVLDRVVSSYSPSIKALIYTRTMAEKRIPSAQTPILVSVNPSDLYYSEKEVEAVEIELRKCENGLVSEVVKKKISTKADTKDWLKSYTIFHFSGHGKCNWSDPSQSYLQLANETLTVSDILSLHLGDNPPFLACLSACETGNVGDRALGDEGMHLISACQIAGFTHVIGSLWHAADELGPRVYGSLYAKIMSGKFTDDSVSLSLHHAVREVRKEIGQSEGGNPNGGSGNPFLWASYIHVGI